MAAKHIHKGTCDSQRFGRKHDSEDGLGESHHVDPLARGERPGALHGVSDKEFGPVL